MLSQTLMHVNASFVPSLIVFLTCLIIGTIFFWIAARIHEKKYKDSFFLSVVGLITSVTAIGFYLVCFAGVLLFCVSSISNVVTFVLRFANVI